MVSQIATDHKVVLQGVGTSQLNGKPNLVIGNSQPIILQRTEQNFIGKILAELASDRAVQALTGRINPTTPNQVLTFLQPVHRTFYVAVLEIACDPFENLYLQSRLDSQKIDSAGLVVRRLSIDSQGKQQRQGWRQQERKIQGWLPFASPQEENLDPDPQRRRSPFTSGYSELEKLLFPANPVLAESVSPLFVAPPEICQATGRTILYGLIPVTSFEVSEAPPQTPTFDNPETLEQINETILEMLPYYFRPSNETNRGREEPNSNVKLDFQAANPQENARTSKGKALNVFIATLQQLKYQFHLFEPTPESNTFFNELNRIILNPNTTDAEPLGNFLRRATQVLVDQQPGLQIKMPDRWPVMNNSRIAIIISCIRTILMQRLAALTAGEGRFDELGRQYQVRAFVRLKQANDCQHEPIWSDYSNPFTIAPWYENSNLPPIKVVLPDVLDANTLKNLKPSVSFSVPPKLFNFLQNNEDAKALLQGNGKNADSGGIAWICSFNIPIITLCAYIVLNIFLQLFNLLFWWLPLIKICIPIPKKVFPNK